jgi:predicted nucleic acid-binding protein
LSDLPSSDPHRPAIVLDSNVVLDWLVFGDPAVRPVAAAILQGQLRWIATDAMASELEHVLTSSKIKSRRYESARILDQWRACVQTVDAPVGAPPGTPRCTDPDDQKFIDLALAAGATALLSRDRAVLALAGAARRFGVRILTPAAWQPSVPGELAQ